MAQSGLIELLAGGEVELLDGVPMLEGELMERERTAEAPGIDDETFQSILKREIQDAKDYAEEELAAQRILEQEFYDGQQMPGDDKLDKTRSRAISRDVQDTIKAIMPSLLRIFLGGDSIVAYDPVGPGDEPQAMQATQYMNQIVLNKDNDGFSVFYDAFHDALTKALGPVMWYWKKNYEVTGQEYSGLLPEQVESLASDPEVTSYEVTDEYIEPLLGVVLQDCTVTYRREVGGKLIIEAYPPEERLINRTARSIEASKLYGRWRTLTVSDVVAMGYDYDQAISLGGADELETNEEGILRLGDAGQTGDDGGSADPAMRELAYYDVYIRADRDGDGFAELYRVACGGTGCEILRHAETGEQAIELVDDIPHAEFCPDPVPHLATGKSTSSSVMDVQRYKTNLLRGMLDSLSRSIFPREEVVQNQVNMDDVQNPEIGAIVRVKAPGMIREIKTDFMGQHCLPVLDYMDTVKVNRTGITDVTQGLDSKALQSSTPGAVSAAVSGSQVQIEMLARIFASKGMKRVFKGMLKTITTHQDRARVVRMAGGWAEVDPRAWNASMDVSVEVALGRGSETERLAALGVIATEQKAILTELGPANPVCTYAHYRHTLAEMVKLMGYPDPDKFYNPVDQQQALQQIMQQMQQTQQELQQAQQQVQGLTFELQKHTKAEDDQKVADALKKRTEALENIISAMTQAQAATINPNAANDEIGAAAPFLARTQPAQNPGGPNG